MITSSSVSNHLPPFITSSPRDSKMVTLSLNPSHSFSIHPSSNSISTPIPPTSPFTLGLSLSHVLSILTLPNVRALFPKYANATIKYSQSNPISDPIVLTLPLNIHQSAKERNASKTQSDSSQSQSQLRDESGLHLVFDGKFQRIQIIILSNLQESNVEIHYPPRGQIIHRAAASNHQSANDSNGNRLTRAGLHQYLGPTYPGIQRSKQEGIKDKSSPQAEELLLSYPGLAFGFDLEQSGNENVQTERTDVGKYLKLSVSFQ